MKTMIIALTMAIMAVLSGPAACAPRAPGGDTSGGSAGDNQPDPLPGCAIPVNAEPAAQVYDSKYVYDFYVELWDEDCGSASMADEGGAPDGVVHKPVQITLEAFVKDAQGHSKPAYFLDGAEIHKDVNTPYHVRGSVTPRNAPHDALLIARVNPAAATWVNEELEGGALHCRITRDSRPIVDAKNRRGEVVDRTTDTKPLINGQAQVVCHFSVGVT